MNLTSKFDKFINESGPAATLFFIWIKLSFIIAFAFHFVIDSKSEIWLSWIPSVFGAVTFAMVTIVVMRREGHKNLKKIFPIFDILITLGALNIHNVNDIADFNWFVFGYSFLFAVLTGLVTYSLGMINFEMQKKVSKFENAQTKFNEYKTKFENKKYELTKNIEKYKNIQDQLQAQLDITDKLKLRLKVYEIGYIKWEHSRLSKRKNLTEKETNELNLYKKKLNLIQF